MKALILGHGDHGKDTFAQLLVNYTGMKFISSSEFALDKAVWPYLEPFYRTKEDCFRTRKHHRDLWKVLIKAYNTPDHGKLCREMLVDYDIYVGMRDIEEFEAVVDLFDAIFWVYDSRKPEEPSMQIPYMPDLMIPIDNCGTKEDLAMEAKKIFKMMRI